VKSLALDNNSGTTQDVAGQVQQEQFGVFNDFPLASGLSAPR
jgi:hypothetical protein